MNARPRRLVILCGVAPTLVAAALCLYRPSSIGRLEWRVYDTMVRAAGTHRPDGRVIVVDVDERSLTAVGQWPWRRDLIGRLIGNLRDLGASTVALDMVFAEADRYAEGTVNPDAALAETLRAGRVVLGYALTFDAGGPSRECLHHPLGVAVIQDEDEHADDPFFRAGAAVCNIPNLAQAATASGFLNARPDPDGILRRVPLVMELGGRIYPSLALAAVSAATGTRGVALRVANVNTSTLLISSDAATGSAEGDLRPLRGEMDVPLDGKSNLLLRYRGVKRTFPYVSAVDVLNRQVDPETFTDKIVFVGTSALGTREVVSTPLDTLFTGVEVHATVADNLLQRDFLHRPANAIVIESLVVVALGLAAALLTTAFGLAWGAVAGFACVVTVWTGVIVLLSRSGMFLSPLLPTMGVSSALMLMTGGHVMIERLRADRADRETIMTKHVMVQSLLSLVEIRDAETGRHSRRTQQYARVLAQELATHPSYREYLTPERINLLSTLAPLHDIGKVGVPDRLLHKPGVLTAEELEEMRKHPTHGRDIILKTEREVGVRDDVTLTVAKDIVYTHHEKWDGSGYPQGLARAEIPIAGRLVAVVDVYDAARSHRAYHPAMPHGEVVALIVKGRGTQFDPAVVDAFVNVSSAFQQLSEQSDR
jgi:adenylate cyclase